MTRTRGRWYPSATRISSTCETATR
jgi:hypothetical protein